MKNRFSSNFNHKELLITTNGQNREILTVFAGTCKKTFLLPSNQKLMRRRKCRKKIEKNIFGLTIFFLSI